MNLPLDTIGRTIPPHFEAALRAYIRAEGLTDFLFPSAVGTALSHDNYLDRVPRKGPTLVTPERKRRVN